MDNSNSNAAEEHNSQDCIKNLGIKLPAVPRQKADAVIEAAQQAGFPGVASSLRAG